MKKFTDLAWFRRPLGGRGVGGTRRALPQQVAARGGDVLGQVAEDDVAGLGGAGHGALHQLEVGLVRHLPDSAVKRSIGSTTGCTITEKAPSRAFSWLKAPTSAFTFKTLLRHYAKRALTPRSLNMKLGPRRKGHKGRAGWLA